MEIRQGEEWIFQDVHLPAIFFEAYLPVLTGTATRVYLFALWLYDKGQVVTEEEIRTRLDLTPDQLHAAVVKLVSEGLLYRGEKAGELILADLKRVELERLLRDEGRREMAEVGTERAESDKLKEQCLSAINDTFFSGTMSPSWYRFLESCMTDYHFTPSVVYTMVDEAKRRAKVSSPAYARKMAEDWYQAGVRTDHDLNQYMARFETFQTLRQQVQNYLKVRLTSAHDAYLERWVDDYGFDWPIIEHALKSSVNLSQPNFKYFDAILSRWHEEGHKDLESIKRAEEAYAKQQESRGKGPGGSAAGGGGGRRGRGGASTGGRRISYERQYDKETLNRLFVPIQRLPEDAPQAGNGGATGGTDTTGRDPQGRGVAPDQPGGRSDIANAEAEGKEGQRDA